MLAINVIEYQACVLKENVAIDSMSFNAQVSIVLKFGVSGKILQQFVVRKNC